MNEQAETTVTICWPLRLLFRARVCVVNIQKESQGFVRFTQRGLKSSYCDEWRAIATRALS